MKPTWIIFDVGGVLIDIDFRKSSEKFAAKTGASVETGLAFFDFEGVWHQFERGDFSSEALFAKMNTALHGTLTEPEILDCLFEIIRGEKKDMTQLVQELSATYELGCLSNTNPYHWKFMNTELPAFSYFKKKFASFQLGLAKPDVQIFDHVRRELGVPAEEILLIDDSERNIEGAKAAGWQAVHFTGIDKLRESLSMTVTSRS